jgi:hypothetical protein
MRQVMAEADHLEKLGLTKLATLYPEFAACRDRMQSMVLKWEAKAPTNTIASRMSAVSVAAPLPPPPPPTQPPGVPPVTNVDLTSLTAAADALVALAPQVQTAVDNLEAQIAALKAATSTGNVDPVAIAAIATKLDGVRSALKAAVDDAAS